MTFLIPCILSTVLSLAPAQDKFALRPAIEQDAHTVYQLVREIREFHDRDPNTVSESKIRKYGFGAKPLFKVELAEVDQKIVGMAIYYIGWAGFEGYPEIVLEDIYVQPAYRGRGIGTAFFQKIAKYGVENDCERIVFQVSNWNEKAFAFYEKLGAKKMDDLSIVRMPKKAMETLAQFD